MSGAQCRAGAQYLFTEALEPVARSPENSLAYWVYLLNLCGYWLARRKKLQMVLNTNKTAI